MLSRTHLSISVLFVLLFWNFIDNLFFVLFVLVGTYLPDVDSRHSKWGRRKPLRIFQWFVKHRGIIHSFTFLFVLSVVLFLVFPVGAFGLFVGYGLHLVADGFTREGIRPFYPFKVRFRGIMRTGGFYETGIFVFVFIVDIFLFLYNVLGVL